MFNFNNTETFIEKHFTAEDHRFIREEAHSREHNKTEKKLREELRLHAVEKADEAGKKIADAAAKSAKKKDDLAKVKCTEDEEMIKSMSKPPLKDQLQLYRELGVPNIPKISFIPNKPEMCAALLAAVQWCKAQPKNTSQPPGNSGSQCAADEDIQGIMEDEDEFSSDVE